MHKPSNSLLFGLLLFSALAILSFAFPPAGVKLAGIGLEFPTPSELFEKEPEKNTAARVIEAMNTMDTTFAIDEARDDVKEPAKPNEPKKQLVTGLQYKNLSAMNTFFSALGDLKNNASLIRLLHYGDSQIEGDRITDFLRLKFQAQFGGGGPGLVSLMPITQSIINKVHNGPGWDRYNVFNAKDKRVKHNNYGVMASFNRFCGYRKIRDTSFVFASSLSITTTSYGGESAMNYTKLKLFYGGSQTSTWCEFYDGPALINADSLLKGGFFNIREYNITKGSYLHSFKFRGKDSPDFYAVSLEGDEGVMVDNIALRGSSGTFFHNINVAQLRQFYEHLNVKLFILQFGGNSIPAITDSVMAANFGDYVRYQLKQLRKMAPDASILFVGPSDMSLRDGTAYVTYPYLEPMRDAIRKAVLESGCAFFDLYDCMGGRNSMPVWVEQKLAGADYTHFTPLGARKIAALLYAALIDDYNKFLKTKS